MIILLPVAHEQQQVQRLPWITFALIAINVVVFLITNPGRDDNQSLVNQKYDELLRYYIDHPYLEFPENTKKLLTETEVEKIEAMKEGAEQPLDEETVENQQSRIDSISDEITTLLNKDPFREYGFVPSDPHLTNLFTCMFMHSGFFHLFGNMLFLFLAGCAIEDVWGRPSYLAFYLVSGLVATGAHQLLYPHSMSPLVGASGAIAGLMGAFLVRLAKTRIRFFYLIWLLFLGIRTGTFFAPAYIVLPLWLLEQFLTASLSDDSGGGVAVWAHIGGFVFGAAVAGVMKLTRLEEKFIAPSIEKKVSLEQNPLFLKGMQLSENKDYPGALICLQKVVRQDPNHFEAYMEMRRIAEVNGDRAGYNRNTAAILDLVLRNREFDLFVDLFTPYKEHPLRDALPARTLMGIGKYFEELNDSVTAKNYFEELVQRYHDDPLAMKAYSRLAHLYHDKLEDKNGALNAFKESYYHPQCSEDWRKGLLLEMKKYGLTVNHLGGAKLAEPKPEPKPKAPLPPAVEEFHSFNEFEPPPEPVVASILKEPMLLPSALFDGSNGGVVKCQIEKIGLKGLILKSAGKTGQLPWKRIRAISVASLQDLKNNGNPLIIDWIAQPVVEQDKKIIYRTFGSEIDFARIFPRVEQSFDEAYRNFIGIVIRNSGARCLPDSNRCVGPSFLVLPGINEYESYLAQSLGLTLSIQPAQ
jgi:membrane associated rhomboid family serine protease